MFEDRVQAGLLLAAKLLLFKSKKNTIVLGIPRGGVVTAKIISQKLHLPLDIIVVRKIGAPFQEELAIGAVGPEGVLVLDSKLISELRVEKDYIDAKTKEKSDEVVERLVKFRGEKKSLNLKNKEVILVDDGIATGATIEAAVKYLRKKSVRKIILAVPVAPKDTLRKFRRLVEKIVVLKIPTYFRAVGEFYRLFPQVTDEEVIQLLRS